jgi:hypothetical protein
MLVVLQNDAQRFAATRGLGKVRHNFRLMTELSSTKPTLRFA